MAHIFISYSHKDSNYAHQLAKALEQKGFSVWIDDRIDYGSQWPLVIEEHVDKCVAFVVIMTPRSKESSWVQNELSRAQRKKKTVFPLLLEGSEPWLAVEATQYVDVRSGELPPARFYKRLAQVAPRRGTVPASAGAEMERVSAGDRERKAAEIVQMLREIQRRALRDEITWSLGVGRVMVHFTPQWQSKPYYALMGLASGEAKEAVISEWLRPGGSVRGKEVFRREWEKGTDVTTIADELIAINGALGLSPSAIDVTIKLLDHFRVIQGMKGSMK
jgi:hypothetical protein